MNIKLITIIIIAIVLLSGCINTYDERTFEVNSVENLNCEEIANKLVTLNLIDSWSTGQGQSMEPAMWTGNIIFLKRFTNIINIKEGNLVLFEEDEEHIVHTVIEIKENYIITRGYNNSRTDTNVSLDDITFVVIGTCYQ